MNESACVCICHTKDAPHSWAFPQEVCCDRAVVLHQQDVRVVSQ